MLENPCFIISLQAGAEIVAILDMILAVIPMLVFISGVIPGYNVNFQSAIEDALIINNATSLDGGSNITTHESKIRSLLQSIIREKESYFDAGIWTIMIFFVVVDLGISYVLFSGAKNKHLKKLKIWFYVRTVTLVLTSIFLITSMCLGVIFRIVVYDIFHGIYRIYTLWVIHAYIQEILIEERHMQSCTYYSKKGTLPTIVVTGIPNNNASIGNSTEDTYPNPDGHKNGNAKFGFQNFGYS